MIRLRKVASVAAATALVFATAGVPAVSAATGNGQQNPNYNFSALYNLPVSGIGKAPNGTTKQFKGNFAIQRVIAHNGQPYAVGTLTGRFGTHHVTRYHVMTPVSLNQNPNQTPTGSASRAHAAQSCTVLHLVLAPIKLNLLGLNLTLGGGTNMDQPIVLDLTAVSGPGNLLGNLLCSVSNLLNQNGLLSTIQGDLTNLTALINSLLTSLGA